MLTFEHVTKAFGAHKAVDYASLTMKPGKITSIIGPNGAGKSTLVNMAAGSYQVTSGRIVLNGVELQRLPKHAVAHAGLGRTYQNIRLFDGMTVMQNLEVALVPEPFQHLSQTPCPAEVQNAIDGISATLFWKSWALRIMHKDCRIAGLRSAKLVELARAMVNDPHAILLDEPAAGLNHGETEELKHHIVDLKSGDIAVVLIEHDMKLIMSISDEIYVMNRGSVLAHGTPSDIRNNQQVQEAYLGQPGAISDIETAARNRANRVRLRSGESLAWHQS